MATTIAIIIINLNVKFDPGPIAKKNCIIKEMK